MMFQVTRKISLSSVVIYIQAFVSLFIVHCALLPSLSHSQVIIAYYKVFDEFGQETSLPFTGGWLNITDCFDGEYVKNHSRSKETLIGRFFRIPDGTNNLHVNHKAIGRAQTGDIYLRCNDATNLKPPSGSVSRVANNPKQCSKIYTCGVSKVPYPPYVCMVNTLSQSECSQYTSVPSNYDNYMGMAHNQPFNTQCKEQLNIRYSKKNENLISLIPGTLIMVMIEDGGVHLYVEQNYTFSCKVITKGNWIDVIYGKEEVVINPEHQLNSTGIVRVDCNIGMDNLTTTMSTYFFIADGELKVDNQSKDGKLACSLPAWISDYFNPVINYYGTEGCGTCTARITICFPKISVHTMISTVKSPKCTDPLSTIPKVVVATGLKLMIALVVITLVLCICIILGIGFWHSTKHSRRSNELFGNEKLKDDEVKMSGIGTGCEVGQREGVFNQEMDGTTGNALLEEAPKNEDNTHSVSNILHEKKE